MSRILFVDDEPFFARNYVQALERAGHEVILKDNAQEGLDCLVNLFNPIHLIVLDFMMPTPAGVAEQDTEGGLATGRWFLTEAKKHVEEKQLPVIVLTNRAAETVTSIVRDDVQLGEKQCRILHKTQTPAFYLPTVAKMMLS